MNNTSVESYMEEGCGRCDRFRTPGCKVQRWPDLLGELRRLLSATELVEEMKWGSPCYTLGGKNVVMIAARSEDCVLSFFKGAALDDPAGLLLRPGPNSRHARLASFSSLDALEGRREEVEALVRRAIDAEQAGVRIQSSKTEDPVPEELEDPVPEELRSRLEADVDLRRAFFALTPGRRRSHILYVQGAKQRETRARRVERCIPKILSGRGFNER